MGPSSNRALRAPEEPAVRGRLPPRPPPVPCWSVFAWLASGVSEARRRRGPAWMGPYDAVVGDDSPTALPGLRPRRARHPARSGCWPSQLAGLVADGTGHRHHRHPPDGKGDPDMHIVTPEPAAARRGLPVLGAGLSRRRRLVGALTGLVVLPLLTLGLAQLRDVVELPSQMLFYLLALVVVALVGGHRARPARRHPAAPGRARPRAAPGPIHRARGAGRAADPDRPGRRRAHRGGAARDRPRHPPGDPVRGRARPGPAHPGPPRPAPGGARHPHRGPGRGGRLLRRVRGADEHHPSFRYSPTDRSTRGHRTVEQRTVLARFCWWSPDCGRAASGSRWPLRSPRLAGVPRGTDIRDRRR
jgi:hypothetical protein